MIVVLSILVIAGMLAIAWVLIETTRRLQRWAVSSSPAVGEPRSESAVPFGPLPALGPVGQIGGLGPDADIDSNGTYEHNLYGD